jgi:hypothetical protein
VAPPRARVDLSQLQSRALTRLVAGDRVRARQALRQLRAGLHGLEREARQACRGGIWSVPTDQEHGRACEALVGIVAVNDEMDDLLDPEGPAAEQMAALDRLARLARQKLGIELTVSPLARLPLGRIPASEVPVRLSRPKRARGGAAYLTCQRRPVRTLLPPGSGVVDVSLGSVAGKPVLAWRRDCAAARPACARDGIALQRITPRARPVGPVVDAGVAVSQWSAADRLHLRQSGSGAVLQYGSDGDQLLQFLGPDLRRQGPPRLVLVHADRVVPQRFAAQPAPAWLSLVRRTRRLSLIRFAALQQRPLSRLLLQDGRHLGGPFGAPALWGGPKGYAAALTTLEAVHFARFDAQGAPRGPARQVALRRGGFIDPICTVIAREGWRFFVLTVGQRSGRTPTATLVGFDEAGRYAGPAAELRFPIHVGRDCNVRLLPTRRHLAVVALARAERGRRGRDLMLAEYKRDGRLAARPVKLATVARLAGVVPIRKGFLVAWQPPAAADRPSDRSSTPVEAARVSCY